MEVKLLDHGYIKLIESWGSDERIIEAARMSTDKGFQGWGREPEWHCSECSIAVPNGQMQALKDRGRHWTLSQPPWQELSSEHEGIPILVANCGEPYCPRCENKKLAPDKGVVGDEKLLAFLWKNKHATPFEMAGAIIEVQAPIFVFREWHRHRTQSYNELSARYTPMPNLNYVPTVERCMLNSLTNKQAGRAAGAEELTNWDAEEWLFDLRRMYAQIESLYQRGLKYGIPKELARLPVPVGRYSRMRASANLRNWLGFLTLRMDSAAQHEIRVYANAVHDILLPLFPRTLALFDEGQK